MILEKSQTAQSIIDKISASAAKVGFIDDGTLAKALMYLENTGIPNNKTEDYKYCNLDAIFKKEFKNVEQNFIEVKDIEKFKLEDTITLVVVNGAFSDTLSDKTILNGMHLNKLSNYISKKLDLEIN